MLLHLTLVAPHVTLTHSTPSTNWTEAYKKMKINNKVKYANPHEILPEQHS